MERDEVVAAKLGSCSSGGVFEVTVGFKDGAVVEVSVGVEVRVQGRSECRCKDKSHGPGRGQDHSRSQCEGKLGVSLGART